LQAPTTWQMKVLECSQLANWCRWLLQAPTIWQMKVLECSQLANRCRWFLQTPITWQMKVLEYSLLANWCRWFLQVLTTWRMKVLECNQLVNKCKYSCNLKQLFKSRFWSALNWLIDVDNYCKLEHPNRLNFRSAFYLPTIEGYSNLDLGWNFPPYLVRAF
jgi:predicted small metal-binding protein